MARVGAGGWARAGRGIEPPWCHSSNRGRQAGRWVARPKSTLTARGEDFSKWYAQVIAKADLVDTSPVRGCMVIKPNGYAVWERIKEELDRRIKDTGHVNAYFPLLIPTSYLTKEAQHVDGFATECAVVTHHRLRRVEGENGVARMEVDPSANLEDPLVVRPTSETMIWSMFSKWIHSHRDLPLLYNQWANVMRWEMRIRPFLRTAEFLWQEGHTAHATEPEAVEEATKMIGVYHELCESILALPTVVGVKSPAERFAGAVETYTIEAMLQNGWALQSGTSHFLGQNFAKAFDVTFQDLGGERKHVWATSWGVSTRLIGGLIMAHSDDVGLVLPPRVAPTQVVVVPIMPKKAEADATAKVLDYCHGIATRLRHGQVRVKVDDRDYVKPGSKFYEWERQGVPVRLEVGTREVEAGTAVVALRVGDAPKQAISTGLDGGEDGLVAKVGEVLEGVQADMLQRARQRQNEMTHVVATYEEMKQLMAEGKLGFYEAAWKCDEANEAAVQADSKATLRCYPLDRQKGADGRTCFYSGERATHIALFARAY